jgi:hypothetical protein
MGKNHVQAGIGLKSVCYAPRYQADFKPKPKTSTERSVEVFGSSRFVVYPVTSWRKPPPDRS